MEIETLAGTLGDIEADALVDTTTMAVHSKIHT